MAGRGWLNIEAVGGTIPETQFFEGDSAFTFLSLSRTQRLYGFIGCTGVGFVLSILGTALLFLPGQLGVFAVLFALGTIVSLVGSGFLIGFGRQIKMMFKPVRLIATIIFLGSIAMIFVAAFPLNNDLLCIIFVIIQYLAYIWYSLSYIPYARAGILKLVRMS